MQNRSPLSIQIKKYIYRMCLCKKAEVVRNLLHLTQYVVFLPSHAWWCIYSDNAILPITSVDPPIQKFSLLLSLICCLAINSSSKAELITAGFHPGPISTKIRKSLGPYKIPEIQILYRSGTLNSNTVNLKFHLIQSFWEIFPRFVLFHV